MKRIIHSALFIVSALIPFAAVASDSVTRADGGAWAAISLHSEADPGAYMPMSGMLISPDYCEEVWIDEYSTFNVPAGTYTLLYSFTKCNEAGIPIAHVYCIQENLEINDGDVVMVEPGNSSRSIRIAPLNEDGEEITLSQERVLVPVGGGDPSTEVLEAGNADFMAYALALHHPAYGSLLPVTMKGDSEKECYFGENLLFATSMPREVLVSPSSEEWSVVATAYYGIGGDVCFAILDPVLSSGSATVLANVPGEFIDIPYPNVTPTHQAMLVDDGYTRVPCPRVVVGDGESDYRVPSTAEFDGFLSASADKYHQLKVYPPRNGVDGKDIETSVTFECVDLMTMTPDTVWIDNDNFEVWAYVHRTFTTTPAIVLTANGAVPVHTVDESYYQNAVRKYVPATSVRRHEWVPAMTDMRAMEYGAAPVYMTSFISGSHNGYGSGLGLRVSTLDYAGAYTSTLMLQGDWSLEYNGRPLWIDKEVYILPDFYAYDRDMQGVAPGVYALRMTSAEERVDGLEACTTFTATVDQTKEDDTAPAIQLLNFVDNNGNFTHEFAVPQEGLLRISAGDFEWDEDTDLPVAKECLPTVEVAPYGSDSWQTLTPELRNPECSPTFAPSYEVSLSDVTALSATGWFDLRVSMTDPSGNSMSQTIAPAFRIESLASGVRTIDDADEFFTIEGRNIIPHADIRIYTVNGQPVDGIGLQPGIYIVASGADVRKVMIR